MCIQLKSDQLIQIQANKNLIILGKTAAVCDVSIELRKQIEKIIYLCLKKQEHLIYSYFGFPLHI